MIDIESARKKLRHMSQEDLKRLMDAASTFKANYQGAAMERGPRWYDQQICGLPKEGIVRLKEDERALSDPIRANHVDQKWLRYAKAFRKMRLRAPDSFRHNQNAKTMYDRLVRLCREHDLPEEIVVSIIPSLVEYIETGRMRPVMFIGEKGCGKTTAVRILMENALDLPMGVVKIPQLSGGRGLTGDNGSYKSADVGCLAKVQLLNDSLLVGYIFDEIDKVPVHGIRNNIDDELLSITDESVSHIVDEYLEYHLVSLPYCPIFFTGNDLNKVNPVLADRCTIIHYPRASASRIKTIMHKYADEKLNNGVYSMIRISRQMLDASIDRLVSRDITSLRKHQELVEAVIQSAFSVAMTQNNGAVVNVTAGMFEQAETKIIGSQARKVGF